MDFQPNTTEEDEDENYQPQQSTKRLKVGKRKKSVGKALDDNRNTLGRDKELICTFSKHDEMGNMAVCSKKFSSRKTLAFHLKTVHKTPGTKLTIYPCHLCGSEFLYKTTRDRHIISSVHKEKPDHPSDFDAAADPNPNPDDDQTAAAKPASSLKASRSKPSASRSKSSSRPALQEQPPLEQIEYPLYQLEQYLPLQHTMVQENMPDHMSEHPIQLLQVQPPLQNSEDNLMEWLTGFNHPRTRPSPNRSISCPASSNCLLKFSRQYDLDRHIKSCHS